MFSFFKSIFEKKIDNLHHIGCYFHYLQACRRKLQEYHFTKKIYQNIYSEYMEKFANFCFIKNITKKRIFYKLKKIEKKYELSNKISNYYINQWIK